MPFEKPVLISACDNGVYYDINKYEKLLESEDVHMERIDILELSQRLIYNTQHTDSIKEKLMNTVKTLYERVQKSQTEKEE